MSVCARARTTTDITRPYELVPRECDVGPCNASARRMRRVLEPAGQGGAGDRF